MSDNLKVSNFQIIIVEKFCQNLKICYFCYMICERQLEDNSGRVQCIGNASRPIFGALSKPRSLSLVFRYKHNPKFSETEF